MPVNRERAVAVMREHRLDAIVTMAPENLTYLAGLPPLQDWESDAKIYAILPAAPDRPPSLIVPRNSVDMLAACDPEVEDVWLYGDFFLWEAEGWQPAGAEEERVHRALRRPHHRLDQEALVACLKAAGLDRARLGFDEKVLPSPQLLERIKALVPGAEVVPASRTLRMIRMVKTAEELARMRAAAAANEAAIAAAVSAARPGVPEVELALAYHAALRQQGGVPRHLSLASGRRAALPNAEPSARRLGPGDVLRIDADCVLRAYFSDTGRCAVLGEPGARLRGYHAALVAGLQAAAAAMRPGIQASQLFRTAVETARASGIPHYDRHHVGHALGCVCYDDPLIAPKDPTPLEAGMVINLQMPYYEFGFGGAHAENTFLVTPTGCEPLQRTSLELQRIG